MRVAAGRPHFIELREVRIDDGADGCRKSKGRDAPYGFCNP